MITYPNIQSTYSPNHYSERVSMPSQDTLNAVSMHTIDISNGSRRHPEGLQGKFTCPASPNSALTRMVMMLVMMIGLWCGGSVSVWGEDYYLKVVNPEIKENTYGTQLFYRLPEALVKDTQYTLTMKVYFENALSEGLGFWPYLPEHDEEGSYKSTVQYTGFDKQSFEAGQWTTVTCSFTAEANHTMLQFPLGHVNGEMRIDDVVLKASGSDVSLVNNGGFDEEVSHLTYSNYGNDDKISPDTWWSWSWALPTVTRELYEELDEIDPTIGLPFEKIEEKQPDPENAQWPNATKTENSGYTSYTTTAGKNGTLFKMENVVVAGCDYIFVKFKNPIPNGVILSFGNGKNFFLNEGITEYKYNLQNSQATVSEITLLTNNTAGITVDVVGVYRHYNHSYILYVPENVSPNPSLVFSLHGAGGKSEDYTPFSKSVADQKGCIVVYPQGLQQNFNGGWAATGDKDEDYYFFKAIIEEVKKKYNIDENRIYCCGFSNGGMMAYSLQNCASDIFAAFASINGYPINEMHLRHTGERPVPFLHIHGKADDYVKYEFMGTIRDNMVARNGCNPVPTETSGTNYTKSVYTSGEGSSFPYVYYEIEGMGHGLSTISTEEGNFSMIMWNFLSKYKLDDTCDKTLKWSSNFDIEEGFDAAAHGWTITDDKTFVYGDKKPNDYNVSHSLQFEKGNYQLRFETSGDGSRNIIIRLASTSGDWVFKKVATVGGKAYIPFSIPEYGEYTLTIIKENTNDKFVSLGAYMTSEAWEGATEVTDSEPENPLKADVLVEIPQERGNDSFTRTSLVKWKDYNTYTASGNLNIAFKMTDIDVAGCDYILIKFAEPVESGWYVAFWNGQDVSKVSENASEYKYVFADDEKCAIVNGVLPQICMMTFFDGTKPSAKVVGVYKHYSSGVTTENRVFKIGDAVQFSYDAGEDAEVKWYVSKDGSLSDVTTVQTQTEIQPFYKIKTAGDRYVYCVKTVDEESTIVYTTKLTVPHILYTAHDLKDLTGTNTDWASLKDNYGQVIGQGTVFAGDGDGSNEGSHVNIDNIDNISYVVSSVGGSNASQLRNWVWDGSGVKTLYPHAEKDYNSVSDWTTTSTITAPDIYRVDVSNYNYLKGVKTAYDGSSVTIDFAYSEEANQTSSMSKNCLVSEEIILSHHSSGGSIQWYKSSKGDVTSASDASLSAIDGATSSYLKYTIAEEGEFYIYCIETLDGGETIIPTPARLNARNPKEPKLSLGKELLAQDFKSWTGSGADATATGNAGCAFVKNTSTGQPYGDGNVNYLNYADISNYRRLIITATVGEPRVMFNRLTDGGTVEVEFPRDRTSGWETVIENGDGTKDYVIDIEKIVADKGFAHLNGIKGANWADVTVTDMFLEEKTEGVINANKYMGEPTYLIYDGNGGPYEWYENGEKLSGKTKFYLKYLPDDEGTKTLQCKENLGVELTYPTATVNVTKIHFRNLVMDFYMYGNDNWFKSNKGNADAEGYYNKKVVVSDEEVVSVADQDVIEHRVAAEIKTKTSDNGLTDATFKVHKIEGPVKLGFGKIAGYASDIKVKDASGNVVMTIDKANLSPGSSPDYTSNKQNIYYCIYDYKGTEETSITVTTDRAEGIEIVPYFSVTKTAPEIATDLEASYYYDSESKSVTIGIDAVGATRYVWYACDAEGNKTGEEHETTEPSYTISGLEGDIYYRCDLKNAWGEDYVTKSGITHIQPISEKVDVPTTWDFTENTDNTAFLEFKNSSSENVEASSLTHEEGKGISYSESEALTVRVPKLNGYPVLRYYIVTGEDVSDTHRAVEGTGDNAVEKAEYVARKEIVLSEGVVLYEDITVPTGSYLKKIELVNTAQLSKVVLSEPTYNYEDETWTYTASHELSLATIKYQEYGGDVVTLTDDLTFKVSMNTTFEIWAEDLTTGEGLHYTASEKRLVTSPQGKLTVTFNPEGNDKVVYQTGELKISKAYSTKATAIIKLTGDYLTPGTVGTVTIPEVAGLSINSTDFTVGSNGTVTKWFLVTYETNSEVAKTNANIQFSIEGGNTYNFPITYERNVARDTESYPLEPVKGSYTLDLSNYDFGGYVKMTGEGDMPSRYEYVIPGYIPGLEALPELKNLEMQAEYMWRNQSGDMHWQGDHIRLRVESDGLLKVKAFNTSGDQRRLAIRYGGVTYSNAAWNIYKVDPKKPQEEFTLPVKAGDVEIMAFVYTDKETEDRVYAIPEGQDMGLPKFFKVQRIVYKAIAQDPTITIDDNSEGHNGTWKVSLSTNDEDDEIYYTLDGSEPTSASEKYTAPFDLPTNYVIKARTLTMGKSPSNIVVKNGLTYTTAKLNVHVPSGHGVVTPLYVVENNEYIVGFPLRLDATPKMGYVFEKFTRDAAGNTTLSTSDPYDYTIQSGTNNVYAWFKEIAQREVTLNLTQDQKDAITAAGGDFSGYGYSTPMTLSSLSIPGTYTIYYPGHTLDYWYASENGTEAAGAKHYLPGKSYMEEETSAIKLYPHFSETANLFEYRPNKLSIHWEFRTAFGSQAGQAENKANAFYFNTHATIGSDAVDVPLKLSVKNSRVDNTQHSDWCTMTEGTEIEIPSGAGAVFRFATWAPLEDNDKATLIGGNHFDSHTEATDDNGVKYYIYTYTTQSNDQTITLRIGDDFAYYKYLEADLPSADRVELYYESNNEQMGTVGVVATQGASSSTVDGVASTTDDGVYYPKGVNIRMTATRKTFYQFDHWEMCVDQEHGDDNWQTIATGSKYRTVEFTVNADKSLTFTLADYVHVRAVFVDKPSYYVNFSAGQYAEGLPPQQIHMEVGEKFTMPICNQTLFYRGNTLKYWSTKDDGSGTRYDFNQSYVMPEGVTSLMLYPVFELNKYTLFDLPLEISEDGQTVTENDVEIVWNLTRTDRPTDNIKAGPTLNYQKSTGVLVAQLDFGEDKGFIDLPLYINASADGAKVNNEANPTRCQVNAGTVLGISALPQSDYYLTAADGMTIVNTTIGETNGTTTGVDVDGRYLPITWNAQTVCMSTYRRDAIVNIDFKQESGGGYYKYVKAVYRHGYYWENQEDKYKDGYWWVPKLDKVTVDGVAMTDDLLTPLKESKECTYEYDPNYTSNELPVIAATQNKGDDGYVIVKQATIDNPTAIINVYAASGILTYTHLVHFQKKASATPVLSSVTITDRDKTNVPATYQDGTFVVSQTMNAHGTISITFDHTMEEMVLNEFGQRMKAESSKTLKFNYWNLADGEHTLSIPKSSLKDVYGEAVQKYVVDENETELGENVIIKFTVQDVPSTFTKTLVNYVVDDNLDSYAKTNLDAAGIAHGSADNAFVQANADTGNNYFYIFVPEGEYQLTGNTKVHTSTDTNGKNPAKNDGSRIASVGNDVDNGLTKISRSKVSLVGQGKNKSLLWNKPDFEGISYTATINVTNGLTDFYCQDMTLENRFTYNASIAGQKAGGTTNPAARAVAFWDKGSKSVLKNVSLKSYQDTYYSNNSNVDSRAYFENCDIYGVADFICGDGNVWFEECKLVLRERDGADNILAVQQDANQKWGYVFNNCTVEAENAAAKAANDGKYTLGRPWNNSPAATYLHTTFKVLPVAQGWSNMSQKTVLRLHEYDSENEGGTTTDLTGRTLRNTSPEAGSDDPILTDEQAAEYTLHDVTAGTDMFNPTYRTEQRPKVTGVEFDEYDLRWNEDERALCYFIFRSDTEDGDFKLFAITLGEGETAKKTYYCSNVSGWYRVAAANERGGLGEMSAAVEFKQMGIYDLTLSRVYDVETDVSEVVKHVGWSTICLPMNAKVPTTTSDGRTPDTFKVYAAQSINGNVMTLKAVSYMIGGQGYVVYGEPDNYTFRGTSRATLVLKDEEKCESLLSGYDAPVDGTIVEDMSAQGVNCYTLAYKPNISGIGFYKFNGATLKPNKAWLDVTVYNEQNNNSLETQNLAKARGIIFVFTDNDEAPTTIGLIEQGSANAYSESNDIYDLMGRRVTVPEKGKIYIVNHKKVVW